MSSSTLTENALPPALLSALQKAVGAANVLTSRNETTVYDCDGMTLHKSLPGAVVFVSSTAEISAVVKACNASNYPFIARGTGTGLSGGTLALNSAVVIELARMNRILEINVSDRYAIVEPGVINVNLTKACTGHALHFAPDPSSQGACTIGGNVAENSGGPHTLKYGVTINHIIGVEAVLPSGEIVTFGGPAPLSPGYDLTGLFIGSEGTFGIASKIWCRLTPNPEAVKTLLAVFPTVDAASHAVTGIIGAGIVPAALELIDKHIIRALESWLHLGFPLDAGAVLLIELDGLRDGLDSLAERVMSVCNEHGCISVRAAKDSAERLLLWKARKQAFGAVGRICPSFYIQDGVIPRTKLPAMLAKIDALGQKYSLIVCNVFHAGDGNLHPIILFDERDPKQVENALACNTEVMHTVVEMGGALSGEHGIGLEKLEFMTMVYNEDDLEGMRRVRDVFDPKRISNPGKAIPSRRCWEVAGHQPPSLAFGVKKMHG
ncbi:MAG: FAD-linked oxidase C-terminal domain-containing protein [Planctomycetota bacterium]